jgi:hypothetical protein
MTIVIFGLFEPTTEYLRTDASIPSGLDSTVFLLDHQGDGIQFEFF